MLLCPHVFSALLLEIKSSDRRIHISSDAGFVSGVFVLRLYFVNICVVEI